MNNFPSMFESPKDRPSGKGRFQVADIESMGFLRATRKPEDFHIITIEDYYTHEFFVFFDPIEKRQNPTPVAMEGKQDGYIADGVAMLMEAEALCFQNGVGFDLFVLEQCFPWFKYNFLQPRAGMAHSDIFPYKFMDTMIESQLLNPDRKLDAKAYMIGLGNTGPHSLAAHGIRMGRHKPEHDDWSTLTDEMIHRNIEDSAIGRDMHRYLMEGDWAEQKARGVNKRTGLGIATAYAMEIQFAMMMTRQERKGFRLDMEAAFEEYNIDDKLMQQVAEDVAPHIPPRLVTDPYKFEDLKASFTAFTKSNFFSNADSEHLKDSGIYDFKKFFNEIHAAMKSKDEPRMGKRSTMWDIAKKNGDYGKVQKVFPEMRGNVNDTPDPLVAGPFTPVVFEDIGLGGLAYIKEKVLYPAGWRGVTLSESEQEWVDEHGDIRYPWSGKIDDESMEAWAARQEVPEWAQKIVSYYVLRSRRSIILNKGDLEEYTEKGVWPKQKNGKHECRGLLAIAYNKAYDMMAWEYYEQFKEWPSSADEDWRVPAAAFSIGTNTFRCRHRFVVNIPARGLRPLRHLFIATKGYKILGCDGAGLELRMLAHFLADAVYQEIVLNGDIHTHNMLKAGLPNRDIAKTFVYAFLYGSGAANLARVTGMSEQDMAKCIENFKAELPALAELIARCEDAGKKFGYLQAVDGRWGRIRKSGGKISIHTVLNVLLQMTGSLAMKYGACFAEDQMIKEGVGLDASGFPAFVANQHDEVQMEVPEDEVLEVEYSLTYDVNHPEGEKKAIKASWGEDEKREHKDEEGRIWSAPSIQGKPENGIINVKRCYHRAGQILSEQFTYAGVYLKLRTPLGAEYKIGNNWHDTH